MFKRGWLKGQPLFILSPKQVFSHLSFILDKMLIKYFTLIVLIINICLLYLQHLLIMFCHEAVSKERRRLEKELLFYLRKYRFFQSRFTHNSDLDWIIAQIVEELKSDI